MTSIQVEPDELRAAASNLEQIGGEIDRLADYAKEADPDWYVWGAPGLVTAPIYFMIADFFHQSIADTKGAIEGLGAAIAACADAHEAADDEVRSSFAKIESDMEAS